MAGKGPELRKGFDRFLYEKNFPFKEKQTVSFWESKYGYKGIDESLFQEIPFGTKITEDRFLAILDMTDEDVEKMKNDQDSMSRSEFLKLVNARIETQRSKVK